MIFRVINKPSLVGKNEEAAFYIPSNLKKETPVIFALHGNWATRKRYKHYGEFFAENGFLTVAPTYRHHYPGNENNEDLGKVSIFDYASDVNLLIDNLYGGKLMPGFTPSFPPILMGHSMGGLVAQVIASRRKIGALVLLNSAPPAGVSLHADSDYKQRIKKFAKLIFDGKPYRPDRETYDLYVTSGMPEDAREDLYKRAVYESGTATREILAGSGSGLTRVIARALSKPVRVKPRDVECPILIISCGKDKLIVPAVGFGIWQKYLFDSEYRVSFRKFPGFAHWVQYEPGWEESARYVLTWIKSTARF